MGNETTSKLLVWPFLTLLVLGDTMSDCFGETREERQYWLAGMVVRERKSC